MASCAVCLQPILKAQQFALTGTEVVHRGCSSAAYRSKARLAEATIARLEHDLAEAQRATTSTRAAAVLARSVARQAESTAEGLRAQLEFARERQTTTAAELQGARSQVIALRAELGQAQASATATASRGASDSHSPATGEVQDEGAVRFSLLEMDAVDAMDDEGT